MTGHLDASVENKGLLDLLRVDDGAWKVNSHALANLVDEIRTVGALAPLNELNQFSNSRLTRSRQSTGHIFPKQRGLNFLDERKLRRYKWYSSLLFQK